MPSRVYEVDLAPTSSLARFDELIADVTNIIERHVKAGGLSGKPSTDESPLSRAAVLMLYAAWEFYVEDSLLDAIGRLLLLEPDELPDALRKYVGSRVTGNPWALAGDAWRAETLKWAQKRIEGPEGFNDAHYEKITSLQRDFLGESPLEDVRWMNQSPEQVKDRVDAFVDLRGEIAHTGRTAENFWHGETRDMRDFIVKAAHEADYRLMLWLSMQTPTVALWPAVDRLMSDGAWHTSLEVRVACGFPSAATGRNYRLVNEYLARCTDAGVLERDSAYQYRRTSAERS
jgi:hypothetical protein